MAILVGNCILSILVILAWNRTKDPTEFKGWILSLLVLCAGVNHFWFCIYAVRNLYAIPLFLIYVAICMGVREKQKGTECVVFWKGLEFAAGITCIIKAIYMVATVPSIIKAIYMGATVSTNIMEPVYNVVFDEAAKWWIPLLIILALKEIYNDVHKPRIDRKKEPKGQ